MAHTVVLHIGAMKSGTSTIQHQLQTHQDLLAEQGFCFPGRRWRQQILGVLDVSGDGASNGGRETSEARDAAAVRCKLPRDLTVAPRALEVAVTNVAPANVALLVTRAFGLRNLKELESLGTAPTGAQPWEAERYRDLDGTVLTELKLPQLVASEAFATIGV